MTGFVFFNSGARAAPSSRDVFTSGARAAPSSRDVFTSGARAAPSCRVTSRVPPTSLFGVTAISTGILPLPLYVPLSPHATQRWTGNLDVRYHFSACNEQEGARGSDEFVQTNSDSEDVNTSHTCRVQRRTPVTGFTVRLVIISQRATSTPRYKLQSHHEHPTIQAAVTPGAIPDTNCSHTTSTPRYKLHSRQEQSQIQTAVTPGALPDTSCSHTGSTP